MSLIIKIQGSLNSIYLQIGTVERQVIVKLDGFTIFSRYPTYNNMAAGGLLVWANSFDVAPITTFGEVLFASVSDKFIGLPITFLF